MLPCPSITAYNVHWYIFPEQVGSGSFLLDPDLFCRIRICFAGSGSFLLVPDLFCRIRKSGPDLDKKDQFGQKEPYSEKKGRDSIPTLYTQTCVKLGKVF